MRIAISTRRVVEATYGEARDALSEDWSRYLLREWPDAILLPVVNVPDHVERWADALSPDAAILSNGNDWGACAERDETERILVAWCLERGKPVLGVCRGFQVINMLFGGALETDIGAASGQAHGGTRHDVSIVTPAFRTLAGADSIGVNSYHDQGITPEGLGDGLTPFALSDTGVVEGFHHDAAPVLGIQWHPERPGAPADFDRALIGRFLTQGAFWDKT